MESLYYQGRLNPLLKDIQLGCVRFGILYPILSPTPALIYGPYASANLLYWRWNWKRKWMWNIWKEGSEWRWKHTERLKSVRLASQRQFKLKLWQRSLEELVQWWLNLSVNLIFTSFIWFNRNHQLFVVLRGALWDVKKSLGIFRISVYCQHMYVCVYSKMKLLLW